MFGDRFHGICARRFRLSDCLSDIWKFALRFGMPLIVDDDVGHSAFAI